MFLTANKPKIERQLSTYLEKVTTIESIHYVPPCFIILKNTQVRAEPESAFQPLSIDRITLVFSLQQLIRNKALIISKIYLIAPKLDIYNYPFFLKESIDGIIKIINMLAQGKPLTIVMEDSQYILSRNGSKASLIQANIKLKIGKGYKIASVGDINFKNLNRNLAEHPQTAGFFDEPLRYRFAGKVSPLGFSIEALDFQSGKFTANFNGSLKNSILALRGYSTVEDFYASKYRIKQQNKLVSYLKNLMLYRKVPKRINVSPTGLNIFDIDCLIKFESKNFVLENLTFNINNIPAKIKAGISFAAQTSLNFSLSTFADQAPQQRKNNPKSIDIDFACVAKQGSIDGKINAGFLKGTPNNYNIQVVKALFNQATFGLTPDQRTKLFIEKIILKYKADAVYDFALSNCNVLFNLVNKKIKFIKFNSDLYDGKANGHVLFDVTEKTPKAQCKLKVSDVSAGEMETLLLSLFGAYRKLNTKLSSKINGKFACDLEYQSYPQTKIKGGVEIKNGYLDNVRFFVWLAEFFSIPSLAKVDFSNISADFLVTDDVAMLENIDLTSSQVKVGGNFIIKNSDMLASELNIHLATQLLAQSPKFKLLLALMNNDADDLEFDFQLSGLQKSPNFKWLESDFKSRIKKMLPGFVERGIEKKIETAIQSISEQ
jgi:hypothetical protein